MMRRFTVALFAGMLTAALWSASAAPARAQAYAPPAQGYAPPTQGYAPSGQGYAPPVQAFAPPVQAYPPQAYQPLNRYFYYPYYYFPHNYWPAQGPAWPNPKACLTDRPPAYTAFPPFREPHWRYELFMPQHHHRGFHFWLDQF